MSSILPIQVPRPLLEALEALFPKDLSAITTGDPFEVGVLVGQRKVIAYLRTQLEWQEDNVLE